jgi:hypothetical protein
VEVTKVFDALQKEALEIKNMASVNKDRTQKRVTEMQEKIKSKSVPLSNESKSYLRNILNDAGQIGNEMSYLNILQNELSDIPDYQTRNRRNKQLKINQVKKEIEKLKR